MATKDLLLLIVCGVLGFGIVWNLLGSWGKD